MKFGHALKGLAHHALGMVPGGTLVGQFARAYGLEAGDPGKPSKRKSAGSGPKHKAKAKAQHRAKGGHAGPGIGEITRIAGRNIAESLPELISAGSKLAHADFSGLAGQTMAAGPGVHPLLAHLGGHRRRMNPANVHALRRSIRRLKGFHTLEKQVHKILRKAVPQSHPRAMHARSARRK
jgi:hypothetical protein